MSVKALQDYTFVSKYARYNKAKKRRSTYPESITRAEEMHVSRYPQIADEIRWAFSQSRQKRVLGSQRALQYAGEPILRKHARIYNCCSSYVDRMRFFQEALWLLLCGCGTGFSVQHHHIAKLPDFHGARVGNADRLRRGKSINTFSKTYVIPDTIEGWSDALGILLASYLPHEEFAEWADIDVEFDYSLIREKGSPLSSGAGKAPGPAPLKRALDEIRKLLDRCLRDGQVRLRSIDAYDIVMHASDAVISGGVRRSASICLFSPDDELMAKAKTGNWFVDNPQRGRSNNSALLIRNQTTPEHFKKLMGLVKQFGEPGFIWADSTEGMFNPCVEIQKFPVDLITGLSGWAFCNLCEINGKKCKTEEDFRIAARAAAIIGTCQAGYTDFAYLGPVSERIAQQEALLGVSITGMMDSPAILFDPEIQRRTAQLIVEVNKEVAAKIGIKQAARTTCLKPAGTTSLILGTASGIHAHHAKRYIRRIQANIMEAPYQFFSASNPRAAEMSVWNQNGTDAVVAFCVEIGAGSKTRSDMSAIDLLHHVKLTQNNWVEAGTVYERCAQPYLKHNVSNTITVRDDEWDAVEAYIYENRDSFAGISLLSASGDLDYPQAPFTAIKTSEELVKEYGKGVMFASGVIVDGEHAFNGNLWDACDIFRNGVSVALQSDEKRLWLENWSDLVEMYRKVKDEDEFKDLHAEVMQAIGKHDPFFETLEVARLQEHFLSVGFELFGNLDTLLLAARSPWRSVAENPAKLDWLRRGFQYAFRYFRDDTRKMAYALKEVSNFKLWCDLRREFVEVEYSEMIEETDETKIQETVACAGNSCELR